MPEALCAHHMSAWQWFDILSRSFSRSASKPVTAQSHLHIPVAVTTGFHICIKCRCIFCGLSPAALFFQGETIAHYRLTGGSVSVLPSNVRPCRGPVRRTPSRHFQGSPSG